MDFEYQFKDLIELIPFEPSKPPLLGIWNCYGDGAIKYAANQEGLWLCKQGRGFNERTDSRLTGLSKQDIAEKTIEGFGIVYGTKDGAPLLPIPFTAHELFIFNANNGGLITQINERGEFEQKWIADLAERNIDAADLAATILYGDLPMDADIYPSMPAPVETDQTAAVGAPPVEAADGISTAYVAECFADCYYTAQNWPKRLSDAKWLAPFRIGAPGLKGGVTGKFDPLGIAIACCNKRQGKEREKMVRSFAARFNRNPVLMPWKGSFNEHAETFFTPD